MFVSVLVRTRGGGVVCSCCTKLIKDKCQECDTCRLPHNSEDPVFGGFMRWGYKRKTPTSDPDGKQCYYCRRVHRADAILASVGWVGVGQRSHQYFFDSLTVRKFVLVVLK